MNNGKPKTVTIERFKKIKKRIAKEIELSAKRGEIVNYETYKMFFEVQVAIDLLKDIINGKSLTKHLFDKGLNTSDYQNLIHYTAEPSEKILKAVYN